VNRSLLKHALLLGVLLILVSNGAALLGVAYNRWGDPRNVIQLSERELVPSDDSAMSGENSGIALRLRFSVLERESGHEDRGAGAGLSGHGEPDWLNEAKLVSLGFEPATSHPPSVRLERSVTREVLLVLEVNGPAYQQALSRAREHAQRSAARAAAEPGIEEIEWRARRAGEIRERIESDDTRVYVVDAGLDEQELRVRYPDTARYLILPGQVRARLRSREGTIRLVGRVSRLNMGRINVPYTLRDVFDPPMQRGDDSTHHYTVRLAFGRRFEPWILAASNDDPLQ